MEFIRASGSEKLINTVSIRKLETDAVEYICNIPCNEFYCPILVQETWKEAILLRTYPRSIRNQHANLKFNLIQNIYAWLNRKF
jgi:hypothetical protein